MEFGPEVTSSDKSLKVMLNSQDKVGFEVQPQCLVSNIILKDLYQANIFYILSNLPQVFNQIRNEHFSNVFGFLSQKARNLQTAYDVGKAWASCVQH